MPLKSSQRVTARPSGFEFAIADRIEFLDAQHWDSLTAEASVLLSRRYLSALQLEFTEEIVRRFAIIYESGRPVAAVATQTFEVSGHQLVGESNDRKLKLPEGLRRKSLAMLRRRVMMCGNVNSWGPHGVVFAKGDAPERIWPAVADCLYRIRRADRLLGQTDYVIIKDLFQSENVSAAALQPFRYRQLETEPNMVLTIAADWTTFDHYLASLTSRYRAAARKVMKPFISAEMEVKVLDDIESESARIFELYKAVADRADVRMFGLQESTLPRISTALGENFVTVCIRENGELIGFVTVIRDGDTAIGYYMGLDYDVNDRLPLYHRLLFAVIDQAIKWKCARVSFGRTALDAKSRLGCRPDPTFVWVRHRIPLLNFVVQQLLKTVTHSEPPDRSPFKEADEAGS